MPLLRTMTPISYLLLHTVQQWVGSLSLKKFWCFVSKKKPKRATTSKSLIVLSVIVVVEKNKYSRTLWHHNIATRFFQQKPISQSLKTLVHHCMRCAINLQEDQVVCNRASESCEILMFVCNGVAKCHEIVMFVSLQKDVKQWYDAP